MATTTPTVETTKDFILIKIPRRMFTGGASHEKFSSLERGLRESLKEAGAEKLIGPFRSARSFLRALKKPV